MICKARSVTRKLEEGNEEMEAKDAPTCSGQMLKLVLDIIRKDKQECKSIDVRIVQIQGKEIKRTVDLKPLKEAKCQGLWRLGKGLYGLKDRAKT